MKKLILTGMTIAITAAGMQTASADNGWATAGKILTGVAIGSVLTHAVCQPCPPTVYVQPVPTVYMQPAPVVVQAAPAPVVVQAAPVVAPVQTVVVQPAPVYLLPPRVVYVRPAPVFCPPPVVVYRPHWHGHHGHHWR